MASLLAEGESKGAPSEGSVVSNDDETLTSQNLPHELEQMANAKWSLESAANLVEAIDNTLDDTAEDFTEEENAFAPAAKSMKYIEKKIMRRCITSRYCNFKHLDSLLGPFFKSHGTERVLDNLLKERFQSGRPSAGIESFGGGWAKKVLDTHAASGGEGLPDVEISLVAFKKKWADLIVS